MVASSFMESHSRAQPVTSQLGNFYSFFVNDLNLLNILLYIFISLQTLQFFKYIIKIPYRPF